MLRTRGVEGVGRVLRTCDGLCDELVAEELVEARRAQRHRPVRRPVEAHIVAQVGLRLQLGVVTVVSGRQHEQVRDLRRAIAAGDTGPQQPVAVHPVEQRQLGSEIVELPVCAGDRGGRSADRVLVAIRRVHATQMRALPSEPGHRGQSRRQLELLARPQAIIRRLAPGVGGQPAQRTVAAGHDEARIPRRGQRVVEGAEEGGRFQA